MTSFAMAQSMRKFELEERLSVYIYHLTGVDVRSGITTPEDRKERIREAIKKHRILDGASIQSPGKNPISLAHAYELVFGEAL